MNLSFSSTNSRRPVPVAVALGSNLGDREVMLQAAIDALRPFITITRVSPVYETAPWGVASQPNFLNMAVTGHTMLSPAALLARVKQIENELGRMPGVRYGPRLIDIDILLYGDQIVWSERDPDLKIPHPRMAERRFVLRPLADIAPHWLHPTTGRTIAALLDTLPTDTTGDVWPLPQPA